MRKSFIVALLAPLIVCSCSESDGGKGGKLITQEQAHTAVVKFLYNRGYTEDLRIVSEKVGDKVCTYRFMTNGVDVAREVVVDRQTGRAELR